MFERFTDRARRVVVLAQEEARMLNHNYIGTEHILLGLISEGEGVAAQVLVRLGADLNRVRQQVIQLLHGYQGKEVAAAGAGPRQLGLATDMLNRINAIESRLSELEFRVGSGPDLRGLDTEIAQARRDKDSAFREQDLAAAISLRVKEEQLMAEKDSRRQEWAAARADTSALAEEVGQLSDDIEQLRGLLRQQRTEP
jgi:Clp amino terminal domain, pathogenicity island component